MSEIERPPTSATAVPNSPAAPNGARSGHSRPPGAGSGGVEGRVDPMALLIGLDGSAAGVAAGLHAEGTHAVVVDRPEEALPRARDLAPDLVVLGMTSEEGAADGAPHELVAALRALEAVGSILALLPSADDGMAIRAVASGADDVVAPPYSVESILLRARLSRAHPRTRGPGAPESDRTIRIDPLDHRVWEGKNEIHLTGRERELLARMLAAKGDPVRRTALLRDIWGGEQESVAVLDATVHRLRRKLETNPANPKILTTVRGIGYRLEMTRIRTD